MKGILKKARIIPSLLSIAIILLVLLPNVQSQVSTTSEKAAEFVTNVIGLDITNYEQRQKIIDYPSSSLFDKVVKLNLTSSESRLDVISEFRDNELVWCKIYPIAGSPLFTKVASNNSLVEAKTLLEKIQNYSETSYLPQMASMLDKTTLENNILEDGTLIHRRLVANDTESFVWSYNTDSIANNHKFVMLTLQNGSFQFYCNNWDLFSIGSTDIKISQKEAINIAKDEALEKFSSAEHELEIRDDLATIGLSMEDKGNYILYPLWKIVLPLDKAYAGATEIHALLWADTGQISYLEPVGYYGIANVDTTPSTVQSSQAFAEEIAVVGALIAAIVIVLSYACFKRKL
jgi:type II secretory pathway pseudopilin PulG